MINLFIRLHLIFLLVFTPIAFGSVELWAFSVMELSILLILILWAIQGLIVRPLMNPKSFQSTLPHPQSGMPVILLSLFLLLILFQMLPLPSGFLKIISPKAYALWSSLSLDSSSSSFPLSMAPFTTQIHFFKWLTLIGLFIFLIHWGPLSDLHRVTHPLFVTLLFMGVLESLYGMFEFFSGHKYILHLNMQEEISSVTGTFINRNHFAGYLLMVIPLSVGFLISREIAKRGHPKSWRERLASLDGKTLLMGFCLVIMILGLLFSASRMGIFSLLLSFSLITFLFRSIRKKRRFNRSLLLILGLAILWAAWIGLDAVISRFFTSSEDFKMRWNIWTDTLRMIRDFPIFGSGLGTFLQVFPLYRSFHIRGLVTHSENDFLQLISGVGILGAGWLAIVFFILLFKAFSGIRALSYDEPKRYISMGGLVGILALMFHSLVEQNLQIPANAFLYTLLWAIVLRIPKKVQIDPMT